ncbi:MAG: preprotein translocase subunit SecA [Candidatus Bostrichicola ureolyticus]|nr:MAG: preprotein translocase subunit SecA [Candidatus Bostrichicola ureolyticus]
MTFLKKILKKLLGNKNERSIIEAKKYLSSIKQIEYTLHSISNEMLRYKTIEFKNKIKNCTQEIYNKIESLKTKIEQSSDLSLKESIYIQLEKLKKEMYQIEKDCLNKLLPEAFAVVIETSRRFKENKELIVKATFFDKEFSLNKDYVILQEDKAIWKTSWDAAGKPIIWDIIYYDVQILGGIILHHGKIAEMATGEGKTLVATLPIYLNALTGRGVHVVTVNDYLAKRDAAWIAPLMEFHGLKVDCIDKYIPNTNMRKEAYQADITYGSNNEFGFDYLRDNMVQNKKDLMQRELNYVIIDEVDSVLIDEARTPLIISGPIDTKENNLENNFYLLKNVVQSMIEKQRIELSKILKNSRELIKKGDTLLGGFKLLQVYRGLPKYKPLIKFLSEKNILNILQNTENKYNKDNCEDMSTVDVDLYFIINEANNTVVLTDKGIDFISKSVNDNSFFILPDITMEIINLELINLSKEEEFTQREKILNIYSYKSKRIHAINQLLKAYTLFNKDVDYVVLDGHVKIVDEQTGRIIEGRRYADGIHQAIEAKENVKIESPSQTLASITLQNYFRMYNKISGMTGTAETEADEFWYLYKLDVVIIPPNKPIKRLDKEDLVFKTMREKYNAIIEEIVLLSTKYKRPVLVGTTSVEVSELLSCALKLRNIKHNVLNAKLHKKEADIIAQAGSTSVVTIATNMAGRGTDIKLSKEVIKYGGLAILGTERHESRRIDRQLRGRAGRQGDPGSSQFYVSLEDKLMRLFIGSDRLSKLMDIIGEAIQHSLITRSIERAQKKVEENNFMIRKRLLEYDNVMNKQREIIYNLRKSAILGKHIDIDISKMIYHVINEIVNNNKKNLEHFKSELINIFGLITNQIIEIFSSNQKNIINELFIIIMKHYKLIKSIKLNEFKSLIDKNNILLSDGNRNILISSYDVNIQFNNIEQKIILNVIDSLWKQHLSEMDDLRNFVQNAVYEQKDPILVYKSKAFTLFKKVINDIYKNIVSFLFKFKLNSINKLNLSEEFFKLLNNINSKDYITLRNIINGDIKRIKYKQLENFLIKEKGNWTIDY